MMRRSSRKHAGISQETEESFWDFRPGQRVMTTDSIPGVVTEVQDGPLPGTEQYLVTLDNDMGGGAYSTSDLTAEAPVVASLTPQQEFANGVAQTYNDLGGNPPLTTYKPEAARSPEVEWAMNQIASIPNEAPPGAKLASEDYAELAQILLDRPPLAHAEPLVMKAAKEAAAYYLDTPESNALYEAAGDVMGAASRAMATVEVPDESIEDGTARDLAYTLRPDLRAASVDKKMSDDADEHVFIATAGLFTRVLETGADVLNSQMKPENQVQPGTSHTYDWCRFRKNERCMFPKQLDVEGTKEAGYAVYVPEDRGRCPRHTWDAQKACPVAEPGPNSGDPHAKVDATVSWEDGGQHGGFPATSSLIKDAGFEVTASWADVRNKAKRIRSEGGVRIIDAPNGNGSLTVTAEVNGDNNVYETTLLREPGRHTVASWRCGCAWSAYSWGRSPAYKRFEGRMCFLPDTMVSMADGTHKPIQDVRPGDRVLTHDGVGTVLNLWENAYHGEIVGLTRAGSSRQVWATADHGLMANTSMRGNTGSPSTKTYRDRKAVQDKAAWGRVEAGDLRVGDWLMGTYGDAVQERPSVALSDLHPHVVTRDGRGRLETPTARSARVYEGASLPEFDYTEAFAVLLGYYLAEGNVEHVNVHGVPRIVQWTFGVGEAEYVQEVVSALDVLGAGEAKIYPHHNRILVKVSNATLALLLSRLTGTRAANKTLHPDLMQAPLEFQEVLLRTYLNGDGCESCAGTASLELARQLVTVGARLGHYIPRQHTSTNNLGPANRATGNPIYYVETAGRFMQGRERLGENFYGSRVTGIDRQDYCGPVYNLNVDNQHTYAVEDTVVFNCSHALALQYEAQSQGMFGRTIVEQPETPPWRVGNDPFEYVKPERGYTRAASKDSPFRPVYDDAHFELAPLTYIAAQGGLTAVAASSDKVMDFKGRLKALVRGTLKVVKAIAISDMHKWAVYDDGTKGDATDLLYPTYSPTRGLTYTVTASLQDVQDIHGDHEAQHEVQHVTMPSGDLYPYDRPEFDPSSWAWGAGDDFLFEDDGADGLGSPETAASYEATKHEEPEAALPVTDGVSDDEMAFEGSLDKVAAPAYDIPDSFTVEQVADAILMAARNHDRLVTPAVQSEAERVDGEITPKSLLNRIKGRERMIEKIQGDMREKNLSAAVVAERFSDSLRYTIMLGEEDYSRSSNEVLDDLAERGFRAEDQGRVKNYWLREDPYDGINSVLLCPDGFPFELQFHTDASISLKQDIHKIYEEYRDTKHPQPEARRKQLWDLMIAKSRNVPRPALESEVGVHLEQGYRPLVAAASLEVNDPNVKTTSYYGFAAPGGGYDGIFRSLSGPDYHGFERYAIDQQKWVNAPEMARHLLFGSVEVEQIDETTARIFINSHKTTASLDHLHDEALVVEALIDPATAPEMAEAVAETLTSSPPTAGDPRLAWLMSGPSAGASSESAGGGSPATASDGDIAAQAKAFLAKQALKSFTPAEQAEIINEGAQITARNLDSLDLEGTHYIGLEAAFRQAEEDDEDEVK